MIFLDILVKEFDFRLAKESVIKKTFDSFGIFLYSYNILALMRLLSQGTKYKFNLYIHVQVHACLKSSFIQ